MKKIVFYISIIFAIQSCVSFDSNFQSSSIKKKSEIQSINGIYEIIPTRVDTFSEKYNPPYMGENFLEEIDRKLFSQNRLKYDTKRFDYYVELEIENQKALILKYYKNDHFLESKRIKIKKKGDGYLYLKNRNVAFVGVPYLFGAIDVNRMRLIIDQEENLVLEVSNFRGGAIFMVGFLNNNKTKYRKVFRKIE